MKEEMMTYQEALVKGKVREGDYFLVKYPGGKDKLFRLVYNGRDYVMWGPPTEKTITLKGRKSCANITYWTEHYVRQEYTQLDVFEEVHACGFAKDSYRFRSMEEIRKIVGSIDGIYMHPDDSKLMYVLAASCSYYDIRAYHENISLGVFIVDEGTLKVLPLFNTEKRIDNGGHLPARPEAIPKSTLLLKIKGCNGTKESPWICLGSEEEEQGTNLAGGDVATNLSKDEIMRFIQETRERLEKLEKYAQNLK